MDRGHSLNQALQGNRGGGVCFGMPVRNGASYLAGSIESILNQTDKEFHLVILDDASSDASPEIIRGYADRDSRIRAFFRTESSGMVDAWQEVFRLARKTFPEAEFFAWASDHDILEPRWLENLKSEMSVHPGAVLAAPLAGYISAEGNSVARKVLYFETPGYESAEKRFMHACVHVRGAGNMIYGLFRADAVARHGIFRSVLLPDRLLILEASLSGAILQLKEVLWQRRILVPTSIARQRRSLFSREKPWYVCLPWWLIFTGTFFVNYVMKKNAAYPYRGRAVFLSVFLLASQIGHEVRKFLALSHLRLLRLLGAPKALNRAGVS